MPASYSPLEVSEGISTRGTCQGASAGGTLDRTLSPKSFGITSFGEKLGRHKSRENSYHTTSSVP